MPTQPNIKKSIFCCTSTEFCVNPVIHPVPQCRTKEKSFCLPLKRFYYTILFTKFFVDMSLELFLVNPYSNLQQWYSTSSLPGHVTEPKGLPIGLKIWQQEEHWQLPCCQIIRSSVQGWASMWSDPVQLGQHTRSGLDSHTTIHPADRAIRLRAPALENILDNTLKTNNQKKKRQNQDVEVTFYCDIRKA